MWYRMDMLSDSSAVKDMVTNRSLLARLGIDEFGLLPEASCGREPGLSD